MSIQKDQLRNLIRSVLRYLEPEITYSEDAVELLMLTAAQESRLGDYIEQVHGPAKGIFQVESDTEKDIYLNFLRYNPGLDEKLNNLKDKVAWTNDLSTDLDYQVAMVRVHYFRVKETLPSRRFIGDLAGYYKRYYNTDKGKATIQEAIKAYRRYCV